MLILSVLSLLILTACSKTQLECEKDSDCKLIYSGCTCEAVPVTDPRESLDDNGKICIWNDCLGRDAYAACENNVCVKKIPVK